MSDDVILIAKDLSKYYSIPQGAFKEPAILKALNATSFTLSRRKTLAVVGESGCGKTTLAQLVAMINEATMGSLKIGGKEVVGANKATLKALRSRVQIVFQNPYGSLNPRQKIGSALMEPLQMNTGLNKAERQKRAFAMLERVGIRPEQFDRYPHMFSGGQRQRIAIARSLMLEPEILVLDEPVSALDVSIQAQVLNLLAELQDEHDLAYLFITHDLSVVKHIADDVMVMYLGKAVEYRPTKELFDSPQHPYTRALLSATPIPVPGSGKQRIHLEGEIPSPIDPPTGCYFHPRCPLCFEPCLTTIPESRPCGEGEIACHAVNPLEAVL
jgi:dipeptide transport system ATP-binding protein